MTTKEKIIGQWEGKLRVQYSQPDIFISDVTIGEIELYLMKLISSNIEKISFEYISNVNWITKSKYKLTLSIIEDDAK